MFNNIIYFIIVLVIFNVSDGKIKPEEPLAFTLLMLFTTWFIFAGYCRWTFYRLADRFRRDRDYETNPAREYHGLVLRASILAIFLFALDVFAFHLKHWLLLIPGFEPFSVLQGIVAVMVFVSYLVTIWYFSHSAYRLVFGEDIKRESFIISNLKFSMPILFPWFVLSLAYDLILLIPWSNPEGPLNELGNQLIFFGFFFVILMVFMPKLIQHWWGCRPFNRSEKVEDLESFLREKGFRYRQLLRWPIFEGRMMTAGIMGIVPRYRYILVTDALMEILSKEELRAVLAHEMGHAKYRHLLWYVLFFFGFVGIAFGLFDIFQYALLTQFSLMRLLESAQSEASTLFSLILSLPILLSMVIYFRYVMGFFMRHFERQADLYSAVVMGSPRQTISSLEKIADRSGKIRDLPSWHHFSIKERVEYLWRANRDPDLVKKHNRFVAISFGIYVVLLVSLGYLVNFAPAKERLTYHLVARALEEQEKKEPDNVLLYQNLAAVYLKIGNYEGAIGAYERVLSLAPNQPLALNNLAWILVTAPDKTLRNKEKALTLARKAVALERSAMFLDTLAEALYANGFVAEAVKTSKEAISLASEERGYYEKQLKRFEGETGAKRRVSPLLFP
jgi:Zn-dependent protease with chaperone function